MAKTIDLNKNKGRRVIEITLADKSFRIVRVVTGVRQLYGEYVERSAEAIEKSLSLEKQEEETDQEFRDRVTAVTAQVEEFAELKRERYFEMIELILTRNGYELDRSWWNTETDELDQAAFLEACLTKDAPAQKKTTTESA